MGLLNNTHIKSNNAMGVGNNQMFQQLKSMMGMLQTAQNPTLVLQQVAQRNPQMASVLQMCNGKNPKDVFYSLCQQSGIDPNTILTQLM